MEAVTSFETVGHIAHMNLRDEHLPFKHVIGETILLVRRGPSSGGCARGAENNRRDMCDGASNTRAMFIGFAEKSKAPNGCQQAWEHQRHIPHVVCAEGLGSTNHPK